MSDNEHVENHRAFRTYGFVAGAVIVIVLNHFEFIPDGAAAQLVGIMIAGAVAALRYGQVQDAATVKHALKKQEKVIKKAVLEAEIAEKKEDCDCAKEKKEEFSESRRQ